MLTNYNRHFFMRLNMKKSKSVGLVVAFIIIILISAVLSGCSRKTVSGSGTGEAEISESTAETEETTETEGMSDAFAVSEPDGEDKKEEQIPEDIVQTADSIDIPVMDSPCGSLMASDGEYIYFSYRANDEELGGLYRADPDVAHVEKIDRGHFAGLYLSEGNLYYNEGRGYSLDERQFHCLETGSLSRRSITQEEYREVTAAFDQAAEFNLPEDNRHAAVVNDKAYFFIFIPEEEDLSEDPKSHYELISCEKWGEWAPTGISWEYRLAEESMISAYGDYLFYARPCEMKEGVDWAEEGEERYQPCCYNTVTGEETVLMRSCGLNCSVYAVNVTSDYLLVSYTDDPAGDGESLKIEKLSDPAVVFDVGELVRGAETADAFIQQEAERKADEEEALKNEPYGPGTSTLYLSAPDDKSACYRLVRMDGSTEFMVLLSPGEEISKSFSCGRYTLKTAEGDTWISDEEAFGDTGHYSTTDVFTFEDGGSYEIGGGTRGDFYSDAAGGFTGQ